MNYKVFYTRKGKAKLQYDVLSADSPDEASSLLQRLAAMMKWKEVRVIRVSETTQQPIG